MLTIDKWWFSNKCISLMEMENKILKSNKLMEISKTWSEWFLKSILKIKTKNNKFSLAMHNSSNCKTYHYRKEIMHLINFYNNNKKICLSQALFRSLINRLTNSIKEIKIIIKDLECQLVDYKNHSNWLRSVQLTLNKLINSNNRNCASYLLRFHSQI